MVQVLFFSLTFTFIFKVKPFKLYLICIYLEYEESKHHYYCYQIGSHIWALDWSFYI